MLIESLELENVGPFRERLELGPFHRGLNVLAARNEWGKSTVLRALTRALFDKYSSQSEEIRALRPAGSSLSPRVRLVFEAAGQRYRLQKTFLEKKSCELFRAGAADTWERTDDSDRADQRVRELLGAPKLEGRTVKPETWGLLRYLWARQDDPCDWPEWDCAGGEEARRCLASVPLDPQVRALTAALCAAADKIFTKTGKLKGNGPLELAEEQCRKLEEELEQIRKRRGDTEALQREHAQLTGEVAVLRSEQQHAQEEAMRARMEAEAAEKLQTALVSFETAFKHADDALQQIKSDEEALTSISRTITTTIAGQQERAASAQQLAAALPAAEAAVQRAELEAREHARARAVQQERRDRVLALLRIRQFRQEAAELREREELAQKKAGELQVIAERLAQIPAITEKQLESWRTLESSVREITAQLDALGLRVVLSPSRAGEVRISRDADGTAESLAVSGSTTTKALQSMSLELEGWGRIEITSGATGIRELEEQRRAHAAKLQSALASAGVIEIAAAEAALWKRRELEQQLVTARAAVQAQLAKFPDLPALSASSIQSERTHEQQLATLQPTPEELALSATALEAEEQALATALRAATRTESEHADRVTAAREHSEKLRRQSAETRATAEALQARLTGLREQEQSLMGRHAGDLHGALARARTAFVRAETRLLEARKHLPPNAEKLPERSRRAAKAAEEVHLALQARLQALQRTEVLLEQHGAEGLYSRETAVDEALQLARSEATRIREEGLALRLAAGLIEQREQSAIQTVLGPLESRLSSVFAELTGRPDRRVFFDEHLAVRGIGPRLEELIAFTDLSRGAREQLLLALRAAIALELAKKEPPCLVLDDVLVHTDPVRQRNVLDYLETLSQHVQIVILTCHEERYRGVGHALQRSGIA